MNGHDQRAVDQGQLGSFLRRLLDKHYPGTEKVILVMDNLCAYGLSSFYEAFAPEEACQLAQRLEIHYTLWARQLAEHGRDRKQRIGPAVPLQADSREAGHGRGNIGLVKAAQRRRRSGKLAVPDRRCAHQAAAALPKYERLTMHQEKCSSITRLRSARYVSLSSSPFSFFSFSSLSWLFTLEAVSPVSLSL